MILSGNVLNDSGAADQAYQEWLKNWRLPEYGWEVEEGVSDVALLDGGMAEKRRLKYFKKKRGAERSDHETHTDGKNVEFVVKSTHSPTQAAALISRYGRIPGGIVLEGTANIELPVRTVSFDPKSRQLMLDGIAYAVPITCEEFAAIHLGLLRDNENRDLGVSCPGDPAKEKLWGITKGTLVSKNLCLADEYLAYSIFTPSYYDMEMKKDDAFRNADTRVFMKLTDFSFKREGAAIRCSDARVHLNYFNEAAVEPSDITRLLEGNFEAFVSEFSKRPLLQRLLVYGEVAAVSRYVIQHAPPEQVQALSDVLSGYCKSYPGW